MPTKQSFTPADLFKLSFKHCHFVGHIVLIHFGQTCSGDVEMFAEPIVAGDQCYVMFSKPLDTFRTAGKGYQHQHQEPNHSPIGATEANTKI